jgi:DNA polymerase III epsilon subunit-like protein
MPKDLTMPKFIRRVFCFDTETTGLLPKIIPGAPFPPDSAYPHLTQISWVVYNVETSEIEEVVNKYVKLPANVEISERAQEVTGITREMLEIRGKPIVDVLVRFYESYMKCDMIVAHNINFDKEVIRKEMWRNKVKLMDAVHSRSRANTMVGIGTRLFNQTYQMEMFCTMMNTVDLCGIIVEPREPI